MKHRSIVAVASTVTLLAGACSGGGTPTPSASAAATTPPAASGSASFTPAPTVGPGEGALNIIIWAGYAEDGSNKPKDPKIKAYDWVHPFEQATGCIVKSKVDDTSDQMVRDIGQAGGTLYDGVSASGDATNRLIADGTVAAVDVTQFSDFADIAPFLQSPAHNTVAGVHYGVSHGWGGNELMWNTVKVTPAPTSWDVVFDPAKASQYKGKVTAYDSPIYIADAALYLKAHQPSLGITDPYELTQPQFDAAVTLLKQQRPNVGKYWATYTDEIDNFTSGATVVGTTWPYQVNTLKDAKVAVEATVPSESMTGWADTWMMSSHAKHPNCMLKWMAWMITPAVQAQVAENFGEAPANPKACPLLDVGVGQYATKNFCTVYHVTDEAFYGKIAFWKTPLADCGDSRGKTCIDYQTWTNKWTEIKASS